MKLNEKNGSVEYCKETKEGEKPNIIDSRWVSKRKINENGQPIEKARLVIQGFKDNNIYELSETHAPVSGLTLVRVALAIINKFDLEVSQLIDKTDLDIPKESNKITELKNDSYAS